MPRFHLRTAVCYDLPSLSERSLSPGRKSARRSAESPRVRPLPAVLMVVVHILDLDVARLRRRGDDVGGCLGREFIARREEKLRPETLHQRSPAFIARRSDDPLTRRTVVAGHPADVRVDSIDQQSHRTARLQAGS